MAFLPEHQFVKFCSSRMKVTTLSKLAGIGGVFVAVSCYYMNKKIQESAMKRPCYMEAVELLNSHEKAKEVLGEPINLGGVRWNRRKLNHFDGTRCAWHIPLLGTKEMGTLRVNGRRVDEKWHLNIELELEGCNETYSIYDDPLSHAIPVSDKSQ